MSVINNINPGYFSDSQKKKNKTLLIKTLHPEYDLYESADTFLGSAVKPNRYSVVTAKTLV